MRALAIGLALFGLGCGAAPAPAPQVHGCSGSGWVDRSAESAERKVGFGTALGSSAVGYSPKCLAVAAGQTVGFLGDFGTHPLSPGELSGKDAGTEPSPIPARSSGTSELLVTFDRPGVYPYYCTLHEPTMIGAIWVK